MEESPAKKAWKRRKELYGPKGHKKGAETPIKLILDDDIKKTLDDIKGIGIKIEDKIQYIIRKYLDDKGLIGIPKNKN